MIQREQLKALIDELPDASLETVESMVSYLLMQGAAEERFNRPEAPQMGSAGWLGVCNGLRVGGQTIRHVEDATLLVETLHSFDGHLVQSSEQLSISPDKATLRCVFAVSSAGRTFTHEHEFPTSGGEHLVVKSDK